MDLRVSGVEVLLTLHRAYVTNDDTALLQQVSKFKPLADWITNFRPSGFTLSQITVRNVTFVAQRISSVTFDVVLVSKKDHTADLTQTVTLNDEPVAVVLLPIVTVGSERYGVLVSQLRLAADASAVEEAFLGHFVKDGSFECRTVGLLAAAGINTTEKNCVSLASEEFSVGEEGLPPVRFMHTTKTMTKSDFDANFNKGSATVDGVLVARPLKEIAQSSAADLKARLAASLTLSK